MFAESLLESGIARPTRARWTTFASFTIQAALLSLLAIVPMLYPDALSLITVPPVSIPTFTPTPPAHDSTPHPESPHPAATTTGVRYISNTNPKLTFGPSQQAEIGEAPPTGVFAGPRATLPIIGVTAPVIPNVPITKPVVISNPDPANLIHRVQPVYPRMAIISRTEGAVVLHAIILRDGTIGSLQVVSGSALLANAAKDAVQQWRYRPYILNGQIVEVDTQITVNFKLGNN